MAPSLLVNVTEIVSPPLGALGAEEATKKPARSVLITASTSPEKAMPSPVGGLGMEAPGVSGVRPVPV